MEALVEALAEDLIDLTPNFDPSKGTFLVESSPSKSNSDNSCSVRYVSEKSLIASHPPDIVGGGSFEINQGLPLSDSFTGMIDAVTGELVHGKRSYVLTGETYEGPFVNGGLRHGEGAIVTNLFLPSDSVKKSSLPIITSESRYFGSYRNDSPHHGTLVVSSQGIGFTYHGFFLKSRPHGENGTLVKPCGYKYMGDFKQGLFHGYGVETEVSSLGGVYEGEFVNGMRQGHGSYYIKKSRTCNGNDDENHDNENDVEVYRFKGQWNANQKQGEGEEIIHRIESYKGQFHVNMRHGYGSLTFLNKVEQTINQGDHNSNSVEDDEKSKPNLAEVIVKAEGQWRAGKPLNGIHGWTIIYANGDVYTGFGSDFKPKGYGVKRFANKDIYSGQWENGKRNGEGIFISANGKEEYIGEWVDDKIVPLIEEQKDETMGRITDYALKLLKKDFRLESYDHLKRNNENGKSTYIQQREFLKRVVDQSLSLSLLHLDKDLERNKEKREFPKSWPRGVSESARKSDDTSHTESDITESSIEEINDTEIKDGGNNNAENKGQAKLITYPNGDSYLGSLCPLKTHREGYGVYLSVASGSTYSGNFSSDSRQGFGVLLHPLGKYCGDFVADEKQGNGTLILNDASSYNGEFKNNLFHGRGTLCHKDGTVYVGEWVDGLKHGDGYETLPDGRVYMGDFKDSKRHGIGTLLTEPAGSVLYNGSWLSGVYHGEGLLVKYLEVSSRQHNYEIRSSTSSNTNNNDRPGVTMIQYEGSFVNGLRHGFGTLTNTLDGTEYKGEWHKDVPISGKWRISMNGTVFSGEAKVCNEKSLDADNHVAQKREEVTQRLSMSSFNDNLSPILLQTDNIVLPQPDGFGTMSYANGDVYIGQFEKGLRHGSGTIVFPNQERWDGMWSNDRMEKKQGQIVTPGNNDNAI